MHLRVDPVLVLTADRDLQLVPRRRQVKRARERDERLRDAQRDVALESRRLDLRLLAQPLRLEQRREKQREREDDDPFVGGNTSEAEVDEGSDAGRAERVDQRERNRDARRLRDNRQALE